MKKLTLLLLTTIPFLMFTGCTGTPSTSAPKEIPVSTSAAANSSATQSAINSKISISTSTQTSTTTVQPTQFAPIACTATPASVSKDKAVNASGQEISIRPVKLATSTVAIKKIQEEAKKLAPDARIVGNYSSGTMAYIPGNDNTKRVHYGQDQGAEYSWMATFYSDSKKQNASVSYIDGVVDMSIPMDVSPDMQKNYKSHSVYENTSDLVDSCVVYQVAKANGLNEKANYYLILTGYAGAGDTKTWLLWEMSRTDNDSGKEVMGKVINTYIIDGITGTLLKKLPGRAYGV